MSINKTFILTLLLLLSFFKPVQTPLDLTPSPSSPLFDTPSPADTPFAENVKGEERKEGGSGGIVVGVVVALCVVVLGHLVLHNNHPINFTLFLNMADNPPELLGAFTKIIHLNSSSGYKCSYGDRSRVVMWNPTNAAVDPVEIDVAPNQGYTHTVVGFGHAKLVKISVLEDFDGRPTMWDVDVYSLSTRDWRNVPQNRPFKSCKMACSKVCENERFIYFRAFDLPVTGYLKDRSNFFIWFDLERMKFGNLPLPSCLVNTTRIMHAAKVNGSLGLLLENHDGVYDVWIKRWGANDTFFWRICNYFGVYETFYKIGTINVEGQQLNGGYGAPVVEVELRDVGIGGYRLWYFARLLISLIGEILSLISL